MSVLPAICVVISLLSASTAFAQGGSSPETIAGVSMLSGVTEADNERFVYGVVSDTQDTVSQGVTRRELIITDVNGNRQVINVISAELSNGMNTNRAVGVNAVAGVNGEFYT